MVEVVELLNDVRRVAVVRPNDVHTLYASRSCLLSTARNACATGSVHAFTGAPDSSAPSAGTAGVRLASVVSHGRARYEDAYGARQPSWHRHRYEEG